MMQKTKFLKLENNHLHQDFPKINKNKKEINERRKNIYLCVKKIPRKITSDKN
jgi:hypothetical protein